MSDPRCEIARMKTKTPTVQLEPELEEIAGHLNAHKRVMLARKFFRWSKQLYVTAQILRRHAQPKPPPSLKRCPQRRLALN